VGGPPPRGLSERLTTPTVKTLICYELYHRASNQGGRLRVFENSELRRGFGPKRDERTRQWRKLHNGELHNLYSSPDIIRQIKSRRMRRAGHVARMVEGRNVGKPEGKDHLEDQGIDGRTGSKWILGRLVGGCGVDSPGSG
jgi:hypothetical protein